MRYLTGASLLVVILGALNWLLVGIARFDVVAAITGDKFGETNALSSFVYVLVGVSGLGLIPLLVRRITGADRAL